MAPAPAEHPNSRPPGSPAGAAPLPAPVPGPPPLSAPTVLVVDDEDSVRQSMQRILRRSCRVLEAADGATALETLRRHAVDVLILDVRLPDAHGIELMGQIRTIDDSIEIILVTAVREVRAAVEAMKLGAYDYLTKPFDVDELRTQVSRAAERRALRRTVLAFRSELHHAQGFEAIVGAHSSMVRIYALIAQVAPTTTTVLIQGETGTGKELIARAIHNQSPRRENPFVAVNLPAIPESLVESELFGHEKGAFTGAYKRRLGKFELAHGGSIFLDEIGSLRPDVQAKLLRVLQEHEVERLGGTQTIKVDIRLLAASNLDLKQAIAAGAFREDLYYRVNVVSIRLPPLRERLEDIPLLAAHFLRRYSQKFGRAVRDISPDALEMLKTYAWPGNVRELENIIERAVALARGPVIGLQHLPIELAVPDGIPSDPDATSSSLKATLQRIETQLVLRALESTGWNVARAAEQLGVHRNTLRYKLEALGIVRPSGLPPDPEPSAASQ
ncbi:MAG: sigma-54-dependent Fis family transcriptional regulator [Candidatus Rokubacteria bacterium]|nr:sigma-54-dependent Fis family transcriptional regulator [Candidatus Rokubacteria bacterium]